MNPGQREGRATVIYSVTGGTAPFAVLDVDIKPSFSVGKTIKVYD